jgi:hypothetical protein
MPALLQSTSDETVTANVTGTEPVVPLVFELVEVPSLDDPDELTCATCHSGRGDVSDTPRVMTTRRSASAKDVPRDSFILYSIPQRIAKKCRGMPT